MTTRFNRLAHLDNPADRTLPYVNLMDPDADTSFRIIITLIEGGAEGLVLGLPFSDPCADTVAQTAGAERALAAGADTPRALELLARIRNVAPDLPIALFAYMNAAEARGFTHFVKAVACAGADVLLIPDLPASMRIADPGFDEVCRHAGLTLGAYLPPHASDATRRYLETHASTFLVRTSADGSMTTPFGQIDRDNLSLTIQENPHYCKHLRTSLSPTLRRNFA